MVENFYNRKCSLKYCSETGDLVIGRIIDRQGEHYRLDLGDRFDGLLQYYDFEGATKRNRPMLEPGDLIYARIQRTSMNTNAILTCKSNTNKKTWSSGEAEFGKLSEGYMFDLPIFSCQLYIVFRLLDSSSNEAEALETLGKTFKFEVVVGFNGKVWVKAKDHKNTIVISNLIQRSGLPKAEFELVLKRIKNL